MGKGGLVESKKCGKFGNARAVELMKGPGAPDDLFREHRVVPIFPTMTAVYRLANVHGGGDVAEVGDAVVGGVAVDVVDLLAGRAGTEEGFGYETVEEDLQFPATVVEGNLEVRI